MKIIFDDIEFLQKCNKALLENFVKYVNSRQMHSRDVFEASVSTYMLENSDIIDDFMKRIVLKKNDKGSEIYD